LLTLKQKITLKRNREGGSCYFAESIHSLPVYDIHVGNTCEMARLQYSFIDDIVYYAACLMLK